MGFVLFIISFILIFSSTWFVTSIFKSKHPENNVLFFILNFFAQIILSFEFLSLFKQIKELNVILINIIVFTVSFSVWKFKKSPKLFTEKFDMNFEKIKKAFEQDKFLKILGIFFIISISASLFLALYAPVNLWDSMTYHLARIVIWMQNASLSHFETSSIRQVMFPPNAEILYMWILIFIKKDFFAGMVQYVSFLGILWTLTSFLRYMKFSTKRVLWSVFIFASLPEIIMQSSSTQNDLLLGFLLFASTYLFIYGIEQKEKTSSIMSALAMGMAFGVKGSVFMIFPALMFVFAFISYKKEKFHFYKPLLIYAFNVALFFAVLSSYNYILNYFEFKNIFGLNSYLEFYMPPEKTFGAFGAGIIRYILSFFDFTGFPFANWFNNYFPAVKNWILQFFGLGLHQGVIYADLDTLNTKIHENYGGYGILGFLVFLPVVFSCLTRRIFSKIQKVQKIALLAIIPVLFIIFIASTLGFTTWNMRYFVTAIAICSPLFVFTYRPKIDFFKILITTIAIACFLNISFCNSLRPINILNKKNLFNTSREELRYSTGAILDDMFQLHAEYLAKHAKNNSKIGLIFSDKMWYYHLFNQNPTWKIYPLRYDLLTDKKLGNLDYLIVCNNEQLVYNLKNSKPNLIFNKVDLNKFKNFELILKQGEPVQKNPDYFENIKYEREIPEVFYVYHKKM